MTFFISHQKFPKSSLGFERGDLHPAILDSRDRNQRRMASELDPVNAMKSNEPPVRVKGIPTACYCGASVILATSTESLTRGHRYFGCGYDLSDGRAHGCGFKKWLESSILEEFKEIKQDRNEMEQYVEELNVKIDELQLKFQEVAEEKQDVDMLDILGDATLKIQDLELQYEALEAQYGEMQAKYELMQYEIKKLKKSS